MDTSTFKPYGDAILVRILKEKRTAGGLFLPDDIQEGRVAIRCKVEAVGPGELKPNGSRSDMMGLKPGDIILEIGRAHV